MNKLSRDAMTQRLVDANAERKLRDMLTDVTLITGSSYSANRVLYPDHRIPFVDKHMAYMMEHPKLNVDQYLSNLRLMLKKRS